MLASSSHAGELWPYWRGPGVRFAWLRTRAAPTWAVARPTTARATTARAGRTCARRPAGLGARRKRVRSSPCRAAPPPAAAASRHPTRPVRRKGSCAAHSQSVWFGRRVRPVRLVRRSAAQHAQVRPAGECECAAGEEASCCTAQGRGGVKDVWSQPAGMGTVNGADEAFSAHASGHGESGGPRVRSSVRHPPRRSSRACTDARWGLCRPTRAESLGQTGAATSVAARRSAAVSCS